MDAGKSDNNSSEGKQIKIICLMPTFGRRLSLLNNAIACFREQTHPDKFLLIYDDLGTLSGTVCDIPNVAVMSTTKRSPSIGEKYNEMLRCVDGIDYDAVAVWDDDDVYLSGYLASHAEVLAGHAWSKPSSIVSAYFEPPKVEAAHGRFHGSIAVRRDLVEKCPWIDTTLAVFDQMYLAKLAAFEAPGDPCKLGPCQYVYRWQTSAAGHCSGLMGDPDWYQKYRPDSLEPIDRLSPEFDADTLRIVQALGY